MNAILEQINSTGLSFVEFALPMLAQSSVLILILLLVDLALRKKVRAVFRYCVWMLVLVKLVLPVSLSSPLSLGYWFGDKLVSIDIARTTTEAEKQEEMVEPTPAIGPEIIDLSNIQARRHTPAVAPTTIGTGPIVAEPVSPPVISATPVTWQAVVFLVWLAGVTAMGLLLLQRAIFVRGLVAQAKEASGFMNNTLENCCECMGVKRKVGLKVSANATSPAVCGLFRCVILVPQNLTSSLGPGQLQTVLLHELAHIKRGDLWVNLAQTILQIIYFYNPLLWAANCIIRRVREQAVDEMVLVAMGERARQYPQTLVNVAKLAFKRPALSLRLIGVVESKGALASRIKRILNRPIPKKAKLGILGLLAIIIIAALLLPMAMFRPGPPELVIKGTVKDAQTGEPIAGARVFDDGYGPMPDWDQIRADERAEWGAITNSAGEYSFLTWPEHHSIKVEAPGYKPKRESLYDGHFTFNKKDEETFNFSLEPEEVSESSGFKKTLPNGVTVELVGICEHPSEGKQWWRPDGAILESDRAPSDHSRMMVKPDEGEQARELALRFAGQDVEHMSFRWKMDAATQSSSHPFYLTEKREKLKPLRNIVFKLPQNLETFDFSIGVATGEWTTIATGPTGGGSTEDSIRDRGVVFHRAYGEDGSTTITMAHGVSEADTRVVAVDKSGKEHKAERSTGGRSGTIISYTYSFNLPIDEISRFHLQARPYEWVEFKNVSLQPGVKTHVQVEVLIVEDVNPTPPRPELLSPPILGYDVKLNFADPTIRDGSFHSNQGVAFVMSFHSIEDLKPGILLSGLLIGQRTFSLILKDNRITIQDGSTGQEIRSESWSVEEVQFNKVITLPVKYGQKEYSCPIHVEVDRHDEGVPTGSYWFCAYLSGRLPWGAGGRSFEIVNLDQQMEFRIQGDGTDERDAVLGIDIDGDGKINPAERGGEQFNLYEPFQIGSKTYRVTEVDPYLPRVVFHEVSPSQPLHTGIKTNLQVEDTKIEPDSSGEAVDSSEFTGRVVDENGNTIADAQVAISTEKIGVLVSNGKLQPIRSDVESRIVQTDSQGMFDFGQMPAEDFDLIVAHEKGFSLVESGEFVEPGEIHLQPWCCIEGQLAEGRKATENKIWMSSLPNLTWFKHKREYRYETKCDESGHFVFDKVPPGWFEVGYLTRTGENSWSLTSRTPVVLKLGQTTKMRLGGEGRPVTGRFVPPQGYDMPIYFGNGLRSLATQRPERPRPDNYDRMTKRQQQQWYKEWYKTDEYRKFQDAYWHNKNWRQYAFSINKDGSFRIEDVIASKYQFTVWIEERLTGQGRPEEIAGYYGTIEVPEISGGRSDEPLDLGELELTMHNPLRVGDIAPLFEAKTLDGKDLKLIDYRGKFVLLSFWQPVFHPEKQQLQELYDTYGGNRQLEIIGLGGNDTLEEVKNYVRENAIPWPQIYTGEEFKSGIAKDYGGFGIFLIDPEGRIIAKDLRGDELKSVVSEAIKVANVNKPDVQVEYETAKAGKTDTGMGQAEAIEKVSSFIACDLPASVQDVKFFYNSIFGTHQVLIRFDIAPEDLKNLMKNSDKLPDFPDLHKNPKIHAAMVETHKVLKIDWWKPGELESPICAGWQKNKRAMGDPRVWFYSLLKISCSQEDNNLIRVYIDFFSEPDDLPFSNPDMKREIEDPEVWSQKLAGDVFAAIIANDNNSLEALNIDSGLLSELGGYRREYDFSGLNRMVHYQKADRCFVIVSPIRHKEGKYPDQEIRFGFKLKQGIWVAGLLENGNIGVKDDILKREGFEEFSRIELTRKFTDRTPINPANNSAVQVEVDEH